MKIPSIAEWHMYGGGTSALPDTHGYAFYTPEGEFHVNAPTRQGAGYHIMWASSGKGGHPEGGHTGLWHEVGIARSPASAAVMARKWYKLAYPRSNPQRRGLRNVGDRRVIEAFTNRQSASSKKLTTDGQRLDGNWMGGSNIAHWIGDQISLNDLGSKAAQKYQRAIRKIVPTKWIHENPRHMGNPRKAYDLAKLHRKWVGDGPVDIERMYQSIRREKRAAESGAIQVSRGLLAEMRSELAFVGGARRAQAHLKSIGNPRQSQAGDVRAEPAGNPRSKQEKTVYGLFIANFDGSIDTKAHSLVYTTPGAAKRAAKKLAESIGRPVIARPKDWFENPRRNGAIRMPWAATPEGRTGERAEPAGNPPRRYKGAKPGRKAKWWTQRPPTKREQLEQLKTDAFQNVLHLDSGSAAQVQAKEEYRQRQADLAAWDATHYKGRKTTRHMGNPRKRMAPLGPASGFGKEFHADDYRARIAWEKWAANEARTRGEEAIAQAHDMARVAYEKELRVKFASKPNPRQSQAGGKWWRFTMHAGNEIYAIKLGLGTVREARKHAKLLSTGEVTKTVLTGPFKTLEAARAGK